MTAILAYSDIAFYITGGTLPPDALSYVARDADDALHRALLAGQTCYVLNSRQMGKSSLCVRTIQRLKADHVRAVFLDLTKFGGRNLSAEQWYAALLSEVGRDLALRTELIAYWKEHTDLPPVQRLFGALTEIALPAADSPLVVFVDEIDVTRTLPFSTDEFFAAIRQLVVGRANDTRLHRIAFCLLGTAAPQDLIQDTGITPFNVGTRIELRDFTPEEAAPLAVGMNHTGNGANLLGRVLHWTGGHPYLTQRLCRAVTEMHSPEGAIRNPKSEIQNRDVDRLCHDLFLSHAAQESDDNLANVRNRLLKNDLDIAELLTLYGQIRAGKRVADDDTNPLCGLIKLSGVASVENGLLRVRNGIYATVFNEQWARTHLPDAEQRRQREAYRKGVARTSALAGAIIAIVGCLAAFAIVKAREAQSKTLLANQRLGELQAANATTRNALQQANANAQTAQQQTRLANQRLGEVQAANTAKSAALQQAQTNAAEARKRAQAASRNAAAAAANARRAEQEKGHASAEAKRAHTAAQAALEQKDRADHNLYIASMNLAQKEWDNNNAGHILELLAATRTNKFRGWEWGYWNRMAHLDLKTFKHYTVVYAVGFSPDGKRLVTGNEDATAKVWDAQTGKELFTLAGAYK